MEADKMFEDLGYKLNDINYALRYEKDDENVFMFHKSEMEFYKSGEYDGMCDCITMKELKAINKKVEELGWEE